MSDSESSSSELRYESGDTSSNNELETKNKDILALRWMNMNNN